MRLAFLNSKPLYTYKLSFCSYRKRAQALIRLARHAYKINWTHLRGFLQNDVSNFFICGFWRNDFYKARIKLYKSQKSLHIKNYLLASSIATATATVIPTIGLLPAPIKPYFFLLQVYTTLTIKDLAISRKIFQALSLRIEEVYTFP